MIPPPPPPPSRSRSSYVRSRYFPSVFSITKIGTVNYVRRNRKILFNMHQIFCLSVNGDSLQLTGEYRLVWMGWLRNVLNRFHNKYRSRNVVRFISGSLEEINLEIFVAIVKLIMLFYAIIVFFNFTNNLNLLASMDGLKTYMI